MESNSKNLNPIYERKNSNQGQNSKRKSFTELNMMDSFLFEAATEKVDNAILIAKAIIERSTGRKVKKLVVQTQKELKGININTHGIRMDVYTMEVDGVTGRDETTCVYDIEPNNYYERDIARRNRFYQSLIDSKLLPTETPYGTLPDMFSIWILPYDPFGDDRMMYTVKNIVEENNQIVYNDGVTKIFLYTNGTKGGSQKLKELLAFMENPVRGNAVDEELLKILDIIDTVKSDSKERERYMGIMGVIDYERRDAYESGHASGYQDGHEEGRAEGRQEGREAGREEGRIQGAIEACKFMKADRETAQVALMEQFSITEDKAEEYLNLYW